MPESIGLKIKHIREEQLGMTVTAFARRYRLNRDNLYKWEKGMDPRDVKDHQKLKSILKEYPVSKNGNGKVDLHEMIILQKQILSELSQVLKILKKR